VTTRVLLAVLLAAASADASSPGFPVRPLSVELGVRVSETTEQLRKSLGVEADHGVLVMEVQPQGPAERAGLRAGDVLTQVAGERVASASDVLDALENRHAGDTIPAEYVRGGAPATVSVTLVRAEPPRMRVGQWSFPIPGGYSPDDAERQLHRFREQVERQLHDLDERLRHPEQRPPEVDRTAL
jgi:membrane-associated protease RseP (regulator of RpoE activity)